MEATQSDAGTSGTQEVDQKLLMSGKPLHRFVKREPKSLGIVFLILGCAEFLMGVQLASETATTSYVIYAPLWQGLLFVICGILSIYTEVHPSKKLVTASLAMYIVSLFGIMISFGFRVHCITYLSYRKRWARYYEPSDSSSSQIHKYRRLEQLSGIEAILAVFSVGAFVLLIFLSTIARLALKSTRTQVIIQHVCQTQSVTTSN